MITQYRRFIHHLSCFLSLLLCYGVGMAETWLTSTVVLQYKVLVNHHDLFIIPHLLGKMHMDSFTFCADSDFLYLFIMLQHFHQGALATENALTKSAMVLSREDGELLEALVAELDIVVGQHPWLFWLQSSWDNAIFEHSFLLRCRGGALACRTVSLRGACVRSAALALQLPCCP